jgi:hypothetical protein
VIAVAAGGAILLGCGSSSPPRPSGATVDAYLEGLTTEQVKLAAAERRIPHKARSPAALSRSISLLARAVGQLARDLQMIRPPALVSSLHAQLVSIARRYYRQLRAAARRARGAGGEQRAGAELIAATGAASRSFAATSTSINRALGR